jgi:magnesium-transporting ATPase (P-type)
MLTGESVPISKTALQRSRLTSYNSSSSLKEEEKFYDAKEHSKHTLFRGTKVIQTRSHRDMDTVAIVIRTGMFELKLRYSVN